MTTAHRALAPTASQRDASRSRTVVAREAERRSARALKGRDAGAPLDTARIMADLVSERAGVTR